MIHFEACRASARCPRWSCRRLLARAPLTPEKVTFVWGLAVGPGDRTRDDGDAGRDGPHGAHLRSRVGHGKSSARARSSWRGSSNCWGATLVRSIVREARASVRDTSMQDAVILSAARTPTGKFLGVLKSLTASDLGAIAVREAVARAGLEPVAGRRVHPRQRRLGGPWPSAGAAGRPQGGAARWRRRAHDQQGVRLGAESRDAGGAGRAAGRRRGGRGRRHGVHEQHAVRAAPPARGAAHGQRRDSGPDGPRRPVVRVRELPHGPVGRGRRRGVSRDPRRAGRVGRRKPSTRRGGDRRRLVPRGNRPDHAAAEKGRGGDCRPRRAHSARHHRRGPGEP